MAVLPEGNVMEWTGTTAREAWMFPAESMTRVPSGNAHVAVAVYAAAGLGAEVLEARVPSGEKSKAWRVGMEAEGPRKKMRLVEGCEEGAEKPSGVVMELRGAPEDLR
jgi:hypothetical protein